MPTTALNKCLTRPPFPLNSAEGWSIRIESTETLLTRRLLPPHSPIKRDRQDTLFPSPRHTAKTRKFTVFSSTFPLHHPIKPQPRRFPFPAEIPWNPSRRMESAYLTSECYTTTVMVMMYYYYRRPTYWQYSSLRGIYMMTKIELSCLSSKIKGELYRLLIS
eukprot:scaffold8015_cov165-Ochromonas_danica.AAC.20